LNGDAVTWSSETATKMLKNSKVGLVDFLTPGSIQQSGIDAPTTSFYNLAIVEIVR
jgi:hypothetical protein